MPSGIPFCDKLHAYFKMARIAYETDDIANPRKAPKGQQPYIDDNATIVSDSGDTVAHIEATPSPSQKILDSDPRSWQSHALIRMNKEQLYWARTHSRWDNDDIWPSVGGAEFAHVSALLVPVNGRLPGTR